MMTVMLILCLTDFEHQHIRVDGLHAYSSDACGLPIFWVQLVLFYSLRLVVVRIDLIAVPQLVSLHALSMPQFVVVTCQDKPVVPRL